MSLGENDRRVSTNEQENAGDRRITQHVDHVADRRADEVRLPHDEAVEPHALGHGRLDRVEPLYPVHDGSRAAVHAIPGDAAVLPAPCSHA